MKNFILFCLFVFFQFSFSQFPEGFETTVPPAGWTTFAGANGLGTSQNWQGSNISNSGAQSAYVRYENVSGGLAQDWLVTPQFTPTSSTNLLTFMQRQSYTTNYGSVYKVFISTGSQTTHADFALVDTQIETDFTYYYTIKEIDLSAYIGIPIYVAFVLEQDDGDNWLIDDVALTSVFTCDPPTALTVSNFAQTTATVSWTASGSQTGYNLRLYAGVDDSTTPIIELLGMSGTLVDTGSYLVGLAQNSQFYFTIESVCGTDVSSVEGIIFNTLAAPIIPNPVYIEEFNPFPGVLWTEGDGSLSSGPSGTVSDWQSDLYTNQGLNTAAKFNLYFLNTNHWLISPDFDLSSSSYSLNFDVAVTDWNVTTPASMGSDDSVKLLISSDYGSTWTSIYTWDTSNTPSNTGDNITVDLTPYSGIVRFAFLASDGVIKDLEDYDFFVDNFNINSSVLSVTSSNILSVKSYPNPVTDYFNILTKEIIEEVTVFNILGKQLMIFKPNLKEFSLNMENYHSGNYFINIKTENKTETLRVIKN
jgi:hypothetical protein